MSRIEYSVNGVDLRNFASTVETAEGTHTAPGQLGDDIQVPGLDGALDVYSLGQQRRADDIGRVVFAMSLKGVDPVTGLVGGDGTLQDYLDNADTMIRLLYARSLTIDATRPDGTVRRAVGHLVPGESLDFTRERSSPAFGRYVAAIAIPGAHWTDTADVTTGTVTVATGGAVSLAAFAAATAPCTELQVRFTGPVTNPTLTKTDGSFAWGGVISSGRQLLVNTSSGIINSGSGTAWTPGYGTELTYTPGPRYFEIDPTQALSATFTHTGGGTASVEISGKRRYRTS